MRTDGIDMAPEAVTAARDAIKARYGESYVPREARVYKNKAKNAQEAHECIRPTVMTAAPGDLTGLEPEQAKLYDLIWKRALASQMEAARLERTVVEIRSADDKVGLRANGQVVKFDGFLKVYEEGRDDVVDEEEEGLLPEINKGEAAKRRSVTPAQHFTQPPPRYTEATLVKRMEELGIGRPSTYASIIGTIQDREYVRKDKNRLIPEDKGRLVTAFLSKFFEKIVDYDFTADLEERLDDVSGGREEWKNVMDRWWKDFSGDLEETKDLRIGEVLETINEVLAPHLFPDKGDGSNPRLCPGCGLGKLSLKTARSGGAFIGCDNYPDCRYTRPLGGEEEGGVQDQVLGQNDEGVDVWLKSGRFGPYVQLGEQEAGSKEKPKRASIPKGMAPEAVDLAKALELLSLPRLVGQHPEDGEPVETAIGRYGPYVRHGKTYANLKDPEEVFTLGMNRAVELIAEKRANPGRGRTAAKALKELGEHPTEGGPVNVMEGRYGPYVKWGKVNATLPKDVDPANVDMDQAVALIAEKAAKKGGGKKKAATKKTAAKKTTKKKKDA